MTNNVEPTTIGLILGGIAPVVLTMGARLRHVSKLLSEADVQLVKKSSELSKVTTELIKAKTHLEITENQKRDIESQNVLLREQHVQIAQRLTDVEVKSKTLEGLIDQQTPKIAQLESLLKENKSNQETIIKQNKEIASYIETIELLTKERDALKARVTELESQTTQNEETIKDLKSKIDDLTQRINKQEITNDGTTPKPHDD